MRRALVAALLAAALVAAAAAPSPAEDKLGLFDVRGEKGYGIRYSYGLHTWTKTASRRGLDGSAESVGGRAEGRALVLKRLFVGARLDLESAAGEGFTFTEAYLAKAWEGTGAVGWSFVCPDSDCLAASLSVVAVGGQRWSGEPGFGGPRFAYGGLRAGMGASYVYVAFGRDDALDDWHFAGSLHLALPALRGSGVVTEYQATRGGVVRFGFSVPIVIGGN